MLGEKSICMEKGKLVECVPNFSEGKRKEVIDKIAGEIKKAIVRRTITEYTILHLFFRIMIPTPQLMASLL